MFLLTENVSFDGQSSINHVGQCFILSILYVGVIHVFDNCKYDRDHPTSIKQRFKGVVLVTLIAPLIFFWSSDYSQNNGHPLNVWLGCHGNNFMKALFLPLILTMILFSGPLIMRFCDDGIEEFRNTILSGNFVTDIKWYRDYIVAPFTEEFVFRACMLPLMCSTFGLVKTIFLTPLFFGVAHVHHAIEHLRHGKPLKTVLFIVLFQTFYTTLFGAYCSFIYLRTGHLVAVVVCHSFCNYMGFPEFEAVPESRYPNLITIFFFIGLILFLFLLFPMTSPKIYNSIYW